MQVRGHTLLLVPILLLSSIVVGHRLALAGELGSKPSPLIDVEAKQLLYIVTSGMRHQVIRAGTATGVECSRFDAAHLTSSYFYYRCEFVGTSPETGSNLAAYYLVNIWTAEVRDFPETERVTGSDLEKLQIKLRQKHGITKEVMQRYTDAPSYDSSN
jgi:hypothetical protein